MSEFGRPAWSDRFAPASVTPHAVAMGPLQLHVSEAVELPTCRARIRDWLGASLRTRHVDDVLLACGEAMDNALEHGLPPIRVELCWVADLELFVEVHDRGPWIVATTGHDRGFGMPIMTSLMDIVSIDTTDGTTVHLRRRFDR